jgi:DNA-binding MarR family transcriptional regulator
VQLFSDAAVAGFMRNFWSLRQRFVEHISPELRERVGLDVPEVFLLHYIGASDLSPSEIAAQMRLPAHAISRRLDALEKRSLIKRSLDPDDARRRVLQLTPAGQGLLREAAALLEQQVAALLGTLDEGVRDGMLRALEGLAQAPFTPLAHAPQSDAPQSDDAPLHPP